MFSIPSTKGSTVSNNSWHPEGHRQAGARN